MLPLIPLGTGKRRVDDVGGCFLDVSPGGDLVVKVNDSVSKDTLNPFSYVRHKSLTESALGFLDLRQKKLVLGWRESKTAEDVDFVHGVMLAKEFSTIDAAVAAGRVEMVWESRESPDAPPSKLKDRLVVPAYGQDPIWVLVDSWHLSRVSRSGASVSAKVITLSAPFDDLRYWFAAVNSELAFEENWRGLAGTVSKAVRFVMDKFKSPDTKAMTTGAPVPDGTSPASTPAHNLFWSSPAENPQWIDAAKLDLGFVSLKGAPLLGVPASGQLTLAVLEKCITADAGCFDSHHTVEMRVSMDSSLTKDQKEHVRGLLSSRSRFVLPGCRYKYCNFTGKPHLKVILSEPIGGHSQLLFESFKDDDDLQNTLRLVPQSSRWPSEEDRQEEKSFLRVDENKAALRELTATVGGVKNKFKEAAILVRTLEELELQSQGRGSVLKMALKKYRPGIAEEYRSLAKHFKAMYAPLIEEDTLVFLLVLMIEDQTPYSKWTTRRIDDFMHTLRMNEEQFESLVAGVMSIKAAGFFGEGLFEAWHDGLSIESLVRGLSNAFTWTCITPDGAFEFYGNSLVEQAPSLLALGPLFGAAVFGYGMLSHAKHGFDTIAELRRANTVSTVSSGVLTDAQVMDVLVELLDFHVIPWHAKVEPGGTLEGLTFDTAPLGIPLLTGRDRERSVPLVVHRPGDQEITGVTHVAYNSDTKLFRLNGRDGEKFQYFFYAIFTDPQAGDRYSTGVSYPAPGVTFSVTDGKLQVGGEEPKQLRLFLPADDSFGAAARNRLISAFVWTQCELVSGTRGDSPLGVTLRVALTAILARAMELAACTEEGKEKTTTESAQRAILRCLLRGEEHMPTFSATLMRPDMGRGKIAISRVSREFCTWDLY